MKQGSTKVRRTIVEYGGPRPIIAEVANELQIPRAVVTQQVLRAGNRLREMFGLGASPLLVVGDAVRAEEVAGVVQVAPRFELEIVPKFLGLEWGAWREDFFFLATLSRHGRVLPAERIAASRGSRADLATLVGRAIVSLYWDNHRRPLRTYRHATIAEFAIDGDVDEESLVMPDVDGFPQRVVVYDRRNDFNSVIVAAVRSLLPEVRDAQLRRQLGRIDAILGPQGSARKGRDYKVASRGRAWQPLVDLSLDVLRGLSLSFAVGRSRAPGYVVHTWRVWEDLLGAALRFAIGAANVRLQSSHQLGTRSSLSAGNAVRPVWVTPDIAVGAGTSGLLVDAKYKGRAGEQNRRIAEGDLYESLAFAEASGRNTVVLVYPRSADGGLVGLPGESRMFERIEVGDRVVIGLDVEVRGISAAGGLIAFAGRLAAAIHACGGT